MQGLDEPGCSRLQEWKNGGFNDVALCQLQECTSNASASGLGPDCQHSVVGLQGLPLHTLELACTGTCDQ